MKKLFALAAVVAVALTSCVKNEVVAPWLKNQEVAFASFNLPNTKAATAYPTGQTFQCIAKYVKQGETWASNTGTEDFWGVATVAYDNLKTKWVNNAGTYYWPKVGSLTFLAWYPATVTPTVTATGLTFTGLTVSTALNDLLVADIAADKESQTTAVPLLFRHVGSKIEVKFANDDYGTTHDGSAKEFEIKINSLKIGNGDMVNQGDFVQGTGWSAQAGTTDYTLISSATDITNKLIADATIYEQAIVPQEKEDIVITYTVTDNNGFTYDGTYTITGAGDWEAAKRYIYNLTFDFTTSAGGTEGDLEIHFDPTVEDWTDVPSDTTL